MAQLGESRPQCRIAGQRGHGAGLSAHPPRRRDVARQRAGHPEDEVTDADIAGGHQASGRFTPPDRSAQGALAEVSRDDVR